MKKTPQKELSEKLTDAKKLVKIGGKYTHYKNPNQKYTVIAIGLLEENEEPCVIYQAEYGEKIVWVRNLTNFTEMVENTEGEMVPRFQSM